MKKNYCTLFDKNYLPHVLSLYDSLERNASSFVIYCFCMDDESFQFMKKKENESIIPISYKHLETHYSELQIAKIYENLLTNDVIKPFAHENEKHVFHIYNIRCNKRDKLKKALLSENIKTEIHYPIAPRSQDGYKSVLKGNFPISEEIHNTTLSLPIAFFHTKKDIEKVSEVVNFTLRKL